MVRLDASLVSMGIIKIFAQGKKLITNKSTRIKKKKESIAN